jgi:hypothetical protein
MGQLLVFRKNRFWRVQTPGGEFAKIGAPNWMPLAGLGTLGEWAYTVERECLFKVDPVVGRYWIVGKKDDYKRSSAVCGLGGAIYTVSDERLWRTDPETGDYDGVGALGAWPGTVIMLAVRGKLWMIQSERLFEVDPATGDWQRLSEHYGYYDTTTACVWKDRIFVVRRGLLREVRPEDRKERLIIEERISGEAVLAANDDGIFLFHKLDLFRIDYDSREITRLSQGRTWDQVTHVVAF